MTADQMVPGREYVVTVDNPWITVGKKVTYKERAGGNLGNLGIFTYEDTEIALNFDKVSDVTDESKVTPEPKRLENLSVGDVVFKATAKKPKPVGMSESEGGLVMCSSSGGFTAVQFSRGALTGDKKFQVLAIIAESIYLLSCGNSFEEAGTIYTAAQLKEAGFCVEGHPMEMTAEEIAEKLGYPVKVSES